MAECLGKNWDVLQRLESVMKKKKRKFMSVKGRISIIHATEMSLK